MGNKIFKQTNIGNWWGAFRNLGSYVTFYINIINLFVLLINTYILGYIIKTSSPIPIWLVIVLAVFLFLLLLVIAMVLEHKYTIPSFMTYWNQQWYEHGNLLRERLDIRDKEIDEQYERICKKADSIETELKELRAALQKKREMRPS